MKNSRTLVLIQDASIFGRAMIEPKMFQPIEVPPSGEGNVRISGQKCFHGNYIPASSMFPAGIAPYCSECRPYEIAVKENAEFKA